MYTVNLRSNCQTILSIFIIFQFDGRSTLIQMQTGACSEWYSMSVLFYLVQKRSQVENLFDAAAMYYSLILPLASVWVDICVCVCVYILWLYRLRFFFIAWFAVIFHVFFCQRETPSQTTNLPAIICFSHVFTHHTNRAMHSEYISFIFTAIWYVW